VCMRMRKTCVSMCVSVYFCSYMSCADNASAPCSASARLRARVHNVIFDAMSFSDVSYGAKHALSSVP
jgi:hypothetical protein